MPVDVLPAERDDLAASHPGHRSGQKDEPVDSPERRRRRRGEDRLELVEGQEADVGDRGATRGFSTSATGLLSHQPRFTP